MEATTFEVYLKDASTGESPVTSDHLDFYESEVWVQLDADREFYPYEQVAKLREVDSATTTGADEPAAVPAEIEVGE